VPPPGAPSDGVSPFPEFPQAPLETRRPTSTAARFMATFVNPAECAAHNSSQRGAVTRTRDGRDDTFVYTGSPNNRVRIILIFVIREGEVHSLWELGAMRVERWFNVLVLGGAALGAGCGHDDPNEENEREPGSTTNAGSGGIAASGSGGTASENPKGGTSNGGTSNGGTSNGGTSNGGDASAGRPTGGASPNGGSGGGEAGTSSSGGAAVGGTAGDGGAGPGGTSAAGGGAGGDGGGASGMSGSAGSGGGVLECTVDSMGLGKSSDPCGCPCCWARGCLNSEDCCAGFCLGADSGRGCCPGD
jgi:hypothetical protein